MKSLLICAMLLVSVQLIYSQERISIQINAGPVFVSSSYANTGYGAAISLLYPLSDNFDLSLRTGYLKWTSDGDALSLYSYSDKLTFIPILAERDIISSEKNSSLIYLLREVTVL